MQYLGLDLFEVRGAGGGLSVAHAHQDLVSRALAVDAAAVRQLVDLLTPVIQRRAARALLRRPRRADRDIRQEVEDLAQEPELPKDPED